MVIDINHFSIKKMCSEELTVGNLLETPSLQEYTGYQAIELKACVLILHDLYLARRFASLRAVRQKYRQHKVIVCSFLLL